jgi:hypothetical protein
MSRKWKAPNSFGKENKPRNQLTSPQGPKPPQSGRSLAWFRTSACHVDDPGSNPGDRTLLRLFKLVSLAVILFWLKEVCFRVGCWFSAWRRLISCCVKGGSGRSHDDPRYITGPVLREDLLGSRLSPCLRLVPCFVAGWQLRFLDICPSF